MKTRSKAILWWAAMGICYPVLCVLLVSQILLTLLAASYLACYQRLAVYCGRERRIRSLRFWIFSLAEVISDLFVLR